MIKKIKTIIRELKLKKDSKEINKILEDVKKLEELNNDTFKICESHFVNPANSDALILTKIIILNKKQLDSNNKAIAECVGPLNYAHIDEMRKKEIAEFSDIKLAYEYVVNLVK